MAMSPKHGSETLHVTLHVGTFGLWRTAPSHTEVAGSVRPGNYKGRRTVRTWRYLRVIAFATK